MNVKVSNANTPVWKTVTVKSHIPEPLKKLDELAHNLWWTWNNEATALFSSLDKDLWQKVDKNPIELLTHISYKRLKEIASDEEFLARMDKVYTSFRQYMDVKPDAKRPSVAYLCMEYGINHVLKIYSFDHYPWHIDFSLFPFKWILHSSLFLICASRPAAR